MAQKNRLSISNEQRLFLLRELTSTLRGLEHDFAVPDASVEGRLAVAGEIRLVSDLVRKLEARSPYKQGVHY